MSETLTLDDLAVPLRALRLLVADFGHLPAPTVSVSPIYPDRLELSLHCGLPGFEAWRKALGVSPEDVTHHVQRDGQTRVLRTVAAYAGAELELVGYGDVDVPVLVEAGAA
ncbi:hypothetical protein SAMN04487983_10878 [Streptomyces sp. yr375]|uniref:hypothetical protein n=1 Tax=Streptomyces sp. yr375 TaxID=1761906 RepID=UPI0008B913B7|nr:hypothetical protein [Streptomyces sp. yr375]SES49647.1 hypothetical protein SAMN04487983_10878 [Streptomyces sp. yr375]